MSKDPNHLTAFRRKILAMIRRGQTPLDPMLAVADRRQVLWATDALLDRGMIEIGFRITRKGLDALEWKSIKKSEGNPHLNARRRDKCFMCSSRTCHLRVHVPGGEFDEVSCDEHQDALRSHADNTLSVEQKQNVRVVESPERLRRERLGQG